MAGNKQNKVFFASGGAWSFDKFGNRVSVNSLDDANTIQSTCCGINCCENTISLPVNSSNSTTTYPAHFEFVNSAGIITLRLTVDLGAGPVTREVALS